jgi:hypothetical protein
MNKIDELMENAQRRADELEVSGDEAMAHAEVDSALDPSDIREKQVRRRNVAKGADNCAQ